MKCRKTDFKVNYENQNAYSLTWTGATKTVDRNATEKWYSEIKHI